jgi:hypothetical protein
MKLIAKNMEENHEKLLISKGYVVLSFNSVVSFLLIYSVSDDI